MSRTIVLKIRPDLPPHTRRRALTGIGSMASLEAPHPSPAQIVETLAGIRAACRAAGLGNDTLYRISLQIGGGTIASYIKLAEAAGFRVQITQGKSERWKALHSSKDMAWQTPPEIWRGVLARLGIERFSLDPCSPGAVSPIPCADRFTEADDGLSRSWGEPGSVVWVNPPYGKALTLWIDKMIAEGSRGVKVIALVPARTGTRWWHRAVDSGGHPEFLRGRLRFLGRDGTPGDAAPFDSALIWW